MNAAREREIRAHVDALRRCQVTNTKHLALNIREIDRDPGRMLADLLDALDREREARAQDRQQAAHLVGEIIGTITAFATDGISPVEAIEEIGEHVQCFAAFREAASEPASEPGWITSQSSRFEESYSVQPLCACGHRHDHHDRATGRCHHCRCKQIPAPPAASGTSAG